MRAILGDINIQGHVRVLLVALESPAWQGLWQPLNLPLRTFADLGLARDASDALVWDTCQHEQVILITANRNQDGPDSLEATLRTRNTPNSLPVFTVSDSEPILHSRDYTEQVVEQLLEYLIDIDNYRGTGRLYLP